MPQALRRAHNGPGGGGCLGIWGRYTGDIQEIYRVFTGCLPCVYRVFAGYLPEKLAMALVQRAQLS